MVPLPPTSRRPLGLGVLLLSPMLLLAACKEPTLHYELRIAGELPASVLPRASYRGQALSLRRVTSGRFLARFETQNGERVSQHLAELRIGLPTPCGWVEAPFRPGAFPSAELLPRFKQLLEDEERIVGRRGQTVVLSAFIGDLVLPPPLAVTVDWRGIAASARVSLGELPLLRGQGLAGKPKSRSGGPSRAGPRASEASKEKEAELFRVFAPSCTAGRKVQVDGKTIGTLPEQFSAAKTRTAVVIDAAGGHCYRRSSRRYAAAATSRSSASSRPTTSRPATSTTPALYEELQVRYLQGQRIYLAQPAAPNVEPLLPFARCPGFLPGRVRCVDLRPHPCASATSQETAP